MLIRAFDCLQDLVLTYYGMTGDVELIERPEQVRLVRSVSVS